MVVGGAKTLKNLVQRQTITLITLIHVLSSFNKIQLNERKQKTLKKIQHFIKSSNCEQAVVHIQREEKQKKKENSHG